MQVLEVKGSEDWTGSMAESVFFWRGWLDQRIPAVARETRIEVDDLVWRQMITHQFSDCILRRLCNLIPTEFLRILIDPQRY